MLNIHCGKTYLQVCLIFMLLLGAITNKVTAGEQVKVMIVTGVDYPGHPWRTQAVELRKALGASKKIDVRLVEDIEVLSTNLIFDYDVLLLNFKNYDPLKREEAAKNNLLRYISEGGGIMCFHFTGGAFEGWSDFHRVAGRVWNPQARGHDPYQEFTVRVQQKDHPIMQGVSDFKITDELYTCLEGKKEIEVLADAVSSVDGKSYPMVFTFSEGKGRGFYTALGHDAKAFLAPELTTILQNAALWCAAGSDTDAAADSASASDSSRVKEIEKSLEPGEKLLAYLDCGGDTKLENTLKITVLGEPKTYRFGEDAPVPGVPVSQQTIFYDKDNVGFLFEGLDRAKKYRLHLTWWDYDAGGRAQSLIVRSPDENQIRILRPGKSLPNFTKNAMLPETVSLPLPMAFVRDGKLRLDVKMDAGPNALISEIWITEMP